MVFQEKEALLTNGKICLLKSPGPEDAQRMLDYLKQTAAETHFMLRLPEEVTMTKEAEVRFLQDSLENPSAVMINAVVEIGRAHV